MRALYLPLAKPHVQFPFLTSFQRIRPSPMFCGILLNAVNCYGVELLATRPTTKLEDTPCRMSAVVYSIYYQLHFVSGDHLFHRNLRTRRTVLTWMHSVRLMVHYHYHHNYHHHLVFSLSVTELLKTFITSQDPNSIINALMSLSIIGSLMTFSISLTHYWHPVYH